ncbi:aminoglycoside phosphotransferase family protein [Virgibacillus halophilus]|uniref:Aminoglycoside phosphotransferase family protein n=1 Tax=Tigheibacillus halophilus TaxID=361280 RepID=A0ABU5C991_9BACI|nr:aminoglycoside phosphotransferase family protein [Virgibacillus halophilus]
MQEELEGLVSQMVPRTEVLGTSKLKGGISSFVCRVTIKQEEQRKQIIIRVIDNLEWLEEEPDIITHEKAALKQAENITVATPSYIASDDTGRFYRYPTLLMTEVPGKVILVPENKNRWTDGLAKALHAIHHTSISNFNWAYYPYQSIMEMETPSWSNMPNIWENLFDYMRRRPSPPFKPTFIHRDFHPNNVLWENGQVSGVVDWVNACMGPAGIDIGHCRWNLAMLYGQEAAEDFLRSYKQYAGKNWRYDVYWDLRSLLDVLEDPLTVYAGWKELGVDWLTPKLMGERMDDYAKHLIKKIPDSSR